jgi:hypothetical protein
MPAMASSRVARGRLMQIPSRRSGPAWRKREPVVLAARGGPEIVGDLVVQGCGFNVHAKTRASAPEGIATARVPPYHRKVTCLSAAIRRVSWPLTQERRVPARHTCDEVSPSHMHGREGAAFSEPFLPGGNPKHTISTR